MKLWGGLKDTEQLDAYAQYYTKSMKRASRIMMRKPKRRFKARSIRPTMRYLLKNGFLINGLRVIDANYKPDKSVKELEKFYSGLVRPLFAEYTGTENTAGKRAVSRRRIYHRSSNPKIPCRWLYPKCSTRSYRLRNERQYRSCI